MTTTGPDEPHDEQQPPPPPPNPYGAPPPPRPTQGFDQQLQGQFGPPQPPYGQPPGQPPGQPGYGYPQPYAPQAPSHPQATTALVLGIVGLAGLVTCVTFLVAPFAWAIGAKAVKEIDAAPPGTYRGREQANGGRIMGIVGTVLLVLAVLGTAALITAIALVDASSTS